MEKDNHLINIYIKIYNKKTITMDDLRYLAKYDTECFRKTCKNVVYNIPESKPVMEVLENCVSEGETSQEQQKNGFDVLAVLENLKNMENDKSIFANVDAERVKNLLGNLYMELLFPHNDQDAFIYEADDEDEPRFDMKA